MNPETPVEGLPPVVDAADAMPAQSQLEPLQRYSEVPFDVVFELTRCTLKASSLLNLEPGMVLPLGAIDVDSAAMIVDGQHLALAEINRCEEHYSMRISEFGERRKEGGSGGSRGGSGR